MRIRITDRMVKTVALIAADGVSSVQDIVDRSKGAYRSYPQAAGSLESMAKSGYVERVPGLIRVSYRLTTTLLDAIRRGGHPDEAIDKMVRLLSGVPFMRDMMNVPGGDRLRMQVIKRLIDDVDNGVTVSKAAEAALERLLRTLDCQQ